MASLPDWYERTLAHQLEMNQQTWTTLQEHGVDENTRLRLEFFYFAPDRSGGEALASFLRDETDCEVEVTSKREGILAKTLMVIGKTQPTTVSLDILNEWVRSMVLAGAEKGPCEFDGWGAEVP